MNRAVRELEAADLVRKTRSGYELAPTGQLCIHAYNSFTATLGGIRSNAELFAEIDQLPLNPFLFAESEIVSPEEPAIFRPVERVHARLAESTVVRAALPVLASARTLQRLQEILLDDGTVDLLASEELWPLLLEELDTPFCQEVTHLSLLLYDDHSVLGAVISTDDAPVGWAERYFKRLSAKTQDKTAQILD